MEALFRHLEKLREEEKARETRNTEIHDAFRELHLSGVAALQKAGRINVSASLSARSSRIKASVIGYSFFITGALIPADGEVRLKITEDSSGKYIYLKLTYRVGCGQWKITGINRHKLRYKYRVMKPVMLMALMKLVV